MVGVESDDLRFTNPASLVRLYSLLFAKVLLNSGFLRDPRICRCERKRTKTKQNCQKLSEKILAEQLPCEDRFAVQANQETRGSNRVWRNLARRPASDDIHQPAIAARQLNPASDSARTCRPDVRCWPERSDRRVLVCWPVSNTSREIVDVPTLAWNFG